MLTAIMGIRGFLIKNLFLYMLIAKTLVSYFFPIEFSSTERRKLIENKMISSCYNMITAKKLSR